MTKEEAAAAFGYTTCLRPSAWLEINAASDILLQLTPKLHWAYHLTWAIDVQARHGWEAWRQWLTVCPWHESTQVVSQPSSSSLGSKEWQTLLNQDSL